MMGNYWDGIGGFGMGLGWLFMILFWAVVIGGLAALVRWLIREDSTAAPAGRGRPLEILQQRYASGEIGRDEYEQKKRDLSYSQ